MRGSQPRMRDAAPTHSAEWQDLELIFCRLLQHGNMHKRREGVVYASLKPTEMFRYACLMPTEAVCFRVRKCTNNHPMIVAGAERFL